MRATAIGLLCACALSTAHASTVVMTIRGGGRTVCSLGDVDGDGCADVAFGVPESMNGGQTRGIVHVFSGKTGRKLYAVAGTADQQHFGAAVSRFPDFDGDGIGDIAIGAPGPSPERTTWPLRSYLLGSVTIGSGADGRVLRRVESWEGGDRFGTDVRMVGDIDRDGVEDWIVGAPGPRERGGRALIYSGRTCAMLLDLENDAAGEEFGTRVCAAGDVDADGVVDLLVGAPRGSSGRAYVLSGRTGCMMRTIESEHPRFGCAVAEPGDVDRDGRPDFLIGSEHESWVWLCSGAARAEAFGVGDAFLGAWLVGGWGSFGSAIDVVPDLDGDGVRDWLIGDPAHYPDNVPKCGQSTGAFAVISGATRQFVFEDVGRCSFERFGYAVADAGDTDGDGIADFAVATSPILSAPPDPVLRIYSGATGRFMRELRP
jgi:hypothetical protein